MDLGIDGKVALITGASKGLALGIARALAAEGVRVAIASRSRERIDAAAATIPGARGYVHDVANVDAVDALRNAVERDLGPIDILVVSTGGPPALADALAPTIEQWRSASDSLLLGSLALVQAVVPGMATRGAGRVLNISSSSVREPIDNLVLSTAHRAGLLAALKTIARQVAGDGVTINSLLPGRIATDRIIDNYGSIEQAAVRAATEIPAGRLGTVEEFAAAATFLCSAPASYITGTALLVDGGLTRSV
ncbi:MAG: family oxidoreductase [Thermoleophilia bacterium]|nr:family oxidoreductase [Thermoleophilia bacterium]MCZ4497300.1 family oxidoreductase [Thermoleophilia bacterium]